MARRVGVAIVDDQSQARKGLRALLALFPDLEVAGEASDGRQAFQLVGACRPDVVLMDARMPRMSGGSRPPMRSRAGGRAWAW